MTVGLGTGAVVDCKEIAEWAQTFQMSANEGKQAVETRGCGQEKSIKFPANQRSSVTNLW